MKIAIAGAAGRMGKMLIEAVQQADDMQLIGALEVAGSAALGKDAGESLGVVTGVTITSDMGTAFSKADCIIDFTRPEATLGNLAFCSKLGVRVVIGTTGFSEAQKESIKHYADQTGVVFAPNMSIGVNVTLKLLEIAAKFMATGYDIEVIEAHHRHKIDAPSGTALKMGEVLAQALGRDLSKVGVFAREGVTGEREPSSIGFSTIRGGDIVGDHTVMFAGTGERIEITHRSNSRANYAIGSVRACRYLQDKKTGLFDMQDVLGLKNA